MLLLEHVTNTSLLNRQGLEQQYQGRSYRGFSFFPNNRIYFSPKTGKEARYNFFIHVNYVKYKWRKEEKKSHTFLT